MSYSPISKSEDAAHASGDSGAFVLAVRQDTASALAGTSGDYAPLEVDSLGRLHVTHSATPSIFQAVLNDVDIAVKGSAGVFYSVHVTNINAAVRYFQLHNKATAPAGGDTAVISIPIPAGSATVPGVLSLGRDFFGLGGFSFATGISVGISTVAATFTAATTTDHTIAGSYL